MRHVCISCMEKSAVILAKPCGHFILCEDCFRHYMESDIFHRCPICRTGAIEYENINTRNITEIGLESGSEEWDEDEDYVPSQEADETDETDTISEQTSELEQELQDLLQ